MGVLSECYIIRTINSDLVAADDGIAYPNLLTARSMALVAASQAATDELAGGKESAIIETRLEAITALSCSALP